MTKKKITYNTIIQFALIWAFYQFMYQKSFRSTERMLVYLLDSIDIIKLKEEQVPSNPTIDDLLEIIDRNVSIRLKKKDVMPLLNLSKNTFNKKFEDHISNNGLAGKKYFSLLEVYKIVRHWQGEAMWMRLEAFTKAELASCLHKGNYKELASEFNLFLRQNGEYKQGDKLSPKIVHSFLIDIGFNQEEIQKVFLFKYNKEV